MVRLAKERGINLRQNYNRLSRNMLIKQSRYARARQMKRAAGCTRKLRTMLGRVIGACNKPPSVGGGDCILMQFPVPTDRAKRSRSGEASRGRLHCVDKWSLKSERLDHCRFATRDAARSEVLDYITFYNAFRRHSTINYMSPMDFERKHMKQAA